MWILGRSGRIPFPRLCCCAVLPFLKWHRLRTELGWMMNMYKSWHEWDDWLLWSFWVSRICIPFPSPRKASSTESEVNRQCVAATISLEFQRRRSINLFQIRTICTSYVTYVFFQTDLAALSAAAQCETKHVQRIKENLKHFTGWASSYILMCFGNASY